MLPHRHGAKTNPVKTFFNVCFSQEYVDHFILQQAPEVHHLY